MKKMFLLLIVSALIMSMVVSFSLIGCKAGSAEEVEETVEEAAEEVKEEAVEEVKEEAPAEEATEKLTDDTLTYGCNIIIRSMDPIKPIGSQDHSFVKLLYENLVTYNKDNPAEPLPQLAEKWEVSDDASEWTFYLRKGVKFTSGNEMTAEDVVYSFARGIEANFPVYPPFATFLDPATSFEIIDDYTIKMKLLKPYAGFIYLLTTAGSGIVDKDTLEQFVTEDDPYGSLYLDEHSLGTSGLMLKEWVRDERIVFEANPNYWGISAGYHKVPKYKELVIQHVPEATPGKFMLDKGDIDMFFEFPRSIIEEYENDPEGDVYIEKTLGYEGVTFLMNTDYPPFNDPNVRNAVRYGIDYDTIVNEICIAERMDRPFFKPMLGTDDDILYSYDLEKAKEYMKASEYPDGFECTLQIGTGTGLSADWESISLKLQEDMSELGIKINIEQNDWSVMDEKMYSGNYQAFLSWFGSLWNDSDAAMALVGRTQKGGGIVLSKNGYENDEIDRLAELGLIEVDLEKRYEIYREISEIFAEDGPYAFIAQAVISRAFRKDIHGFDQNPSISEIDFSVLYRE